MKEKGREAGSFLEEAWDNNVIEPFGRMYYQLEKSIESLYLGKVGLGY